jgi:signal transduction histidine kinase
MARRLLLTYLTITALTLAAIAIPLGRIFADRERDRLAFDVDHDAQAIASLVEDDLEAGDAPSIDAALRDFGDAGGRIVVVDANGISVADSQGHSSAPRDFSTRPEIAAALDGARTSGTRRSETLGTDLIYVALPVASGGTVHGAVRVTFPTSTLDARVRQTWLRIALMSGVTLAIVAAVGVIFARGVTRPVRELQRAADRLAAGDMSVRIDPDGWPPELGSLAGTFNSTAEQLGRLIESQHRFVADASHQLRTPLAALRLRLETLTPHIAETARPKLDAAVAETDRLARLLQSLLALARSDAASEPPEPVDLAAAIAERVDTWAPVAADEHVRLVDDGGTEAWVLATPGALEQILDNLMSNALEASPPDTTITLHVTRLPGIAELHVVDQGPGMSPEARQQAFERFWRPVGGARSGVAEGFGLGLAIVDQLARQSGGHARLGAGPDGVGLDAMVAFRTAARDQPRHRHGDDPNAYPTLTLR